MKPIHYLRYALCFLYLNLCASLDIYFSEVTNHTHSSKSTHISDCNLDCASATFASLSHNFYLTLAIQVPTSPDLQFSPDNSTRQKKKKAGEIRCETIHQPNSQHGLFTSENY